ncbi:MAG: hypothetical protein ACRENJ_03950 [Candidatus Eiseniibacteriota bacterium]
MLRPVRPVALVILTACMFYPGVTMLYQGLYPFVAQEWFNLGGDPGPWMRLGLAVGISPVAISLAKAALGAAWVFGVIGLWAGDPPVRLGKLVLPGLAYPLTLLTAAGTLLYPGGGVVMAVIGLVCLVFFREKSDTVPA